MTRRAISDRPWVQGRVRYHFASAANAEKFKAEHFAAFKPRFGGFCASGRGRPRLTTASQFSRVLQMAVANS